MLLPYHSHFSKKEKNRLISILQSERQIPCFADLCFGSCMSFLLSADPGGLDDDASVSVAEDRTPSIEDEVDWRVPAGESDWPWGKWG